MIIEIFAWCSSRNLFVQGMTTTYFPDGSTLATLDEDGNLIPHSGVIIDEIGAVVKTPAVLDKDGNVITPAVVVEGHHVNLVAYGEIAKLLTMGPPDKEGNPTYIPQHDADGNLLSVFQRTNVLGLIPGLEWTPVPGEGVPPGFIGPNGVVLYDPSAVNNRTRVFL